MLELLNNPIVQSVIAALLVALIMWAINAYRFLRDEQQIVAFLLRSDMPFRSTEAIAADTHLDPDRIRKVAGSSRNIKRNSKEKESWCLVD